MWIGLRQKNAVGDAAVKEIYNAVILFPMLLGEKMNLPILYCCVNDAMQTVRMWRIRSYGVPFYDTFWSIKGMREYRHIYGNRFMDDFQKIVAASPKQYSESQLETMLRERLDQLKGDVSIHFGQPYLNDATMAGLYRMLLKKMAEELEVDENKWKTGERMKPWWIEC